MDSDMAERVRSCYADMSLSLQKTSDGTKNVTLINLFERMGQALKSGRITSCKSAKDRTSMSITLEEVSASYRFAQH